MHHISSNNIIERRLILVKKLSIIFSIFLLIFLSVFTVRITAETKTFKEGFYTERDLNLTPNITHTVQNTSETETAFVFVFDSNQITRLFIKLVPKSQKFILPPLAAGYEVVIVTNAEVEIA